MSDSPRSLASVIHSATRAVSRREFLTGASAGAAFLGLTAQTPTLAASIPAIKSAPLAPVRMHAGHQHDHTDATLRLLAAFGVNHICSSLPSARLDEHWSVAGLTALRQRVESFGIALDCVPLPLNAREITRAEYPEILLAKNPEREHALDDLCQMIRNAGAAGIPMVTYNLSFLGVVRTPSDTGRDRASGSAFDPAKTKPEPPTIAGSVNEEIYWDRITHFLKRVVPVAQEARVKIALHPQEPGFPVGPSYRGVHTVLGTVEGLQRFVSIQPSEYHGLNFCQDTVSEMLARPDEEIHDVIRWFGSRGKIFNVHFRAIRRGLSNFHETLSDEGDVNLPRALRTYREIGYRGMVMPDHVPIIESDTDRYKAFAFCFGYIQALLQVLRSES